MVTAINLVREDKETSNGRSQRDINRGFHIPESSLKNKAAQQSKDGPVVIKETTLGKTNSRNLTV